MPFTEIYRTLGLSRNTVACWLYRSRSKIDSSPDRRCPFCARPARPVDHPADYAYLLGMYLGDGHLLTTGRVPLLRVACDLRYPRVIAEVGDAMRACGARVVGHQRREGRDDVRSSWMHWPCLLPQHGPGKKHERAIRLVPWQQRIVDAHPGRFLRGLFHSDGCRTTNRIVRAGREYVYPRYQFVNESSDIMRLCQESLNELGVRWRMGRRTMLSVARRDDVAELDRHVGAKC
ncbi:transcriptional regulator [Actinoplanes nipponensis]|uniref:transcriptional regulator n=1 Tax=Actinoplanes nipponensis TaxID=135950 RepID=UPI001EF24D99|nr:transcriptional regulator [Actinoplanes nipponensis]